MFLCMIENRHTKRNAPFRKKEILKNSYLIIHGKEILLGRERSSEYAFVNAFKNYSKQVFKRQGSAKRRSLFYTNYGTLFMKRCAQKCKILP